MFASRKKMTKRQREGGSSMVDVGISKEAFAILKTVLRVRDNKARISVLKGTEPQSGNMLSYDDNVAYHCGQDGYVLLSYYRGSWIVSSARGEELRRYSDDVAIMCDITLFLGIESK